MNNLVRNHYLLFWLLIPVILLIVFFDDRALDISIHDSYYVFSKYHLSSFISMIFLVIGFGYWLMIKLEKRLSIWLIWIHSILTIGGLMILFITPYFFNDNSLSTLNALFVLTGLVIIFTQLFYFLNIILAIFRK
ncbi:hypothetical protein [Polaribacter sp. R77954]|uniref:hypothetical protein n=1 Tax=Polaribacter sp. R77954 TaxID=3093870 RepID=UPI0037C75B1A